MINNVLYLIPIIAIIILVSYFIFKKFNINLKSILIGAGSSLLFIIIALLKFTNKFKNKDIEDNKEEIKNTKNNINEHIDNIKNTHEDNQEKINDAKEIKKKNDEEIINAENIIEVNQERIKTARERLEERRSALKEKK